MLDTTFTFSKDTQETTGALENGWIKNQEKSGSVSEVKQPQFAVKYIPEPEVVL